jgi:hypothetical protein
VDGDPLRPTASWTLLQTLLLPVMAYAAIGLVVSWFVHLMSANRQGVSPRKCPAGHVVGPADNFCPVCGARIVTP